MKNIIKNTSKGFTLIELVMVTIILGILAAVAIPRYQETVDNAEASAEKAFADMIWAGLEEHASETLMETGNEAWPYNPLEVINRSRNVLITMFEGVPDEDALQNDWMSLETSVGYDGNSEVGALDFKKDFGNNGLTSPFQDGSYAYLVIPGSGSGTSAQAPVIVVIDTENPSKLHKTLVP